MRRRAGAGSTVPAALPLIGAAVLASGVDVVGSALGAGVMAGSELGAGVEGVIVPPGAAMLPAAAELSRIIADESGLPVTELRSVLSLASGSAVVGDCVVGGCVVGDCVAGALSESTGGCGDVVGDCTGAGWVVGAPPGVPAPAPEPLGEVVGAGEPGVVEPGVVWALTAAAPSVSARAAPTLSERLNMV